MKNARRTNCTALVSDTDQGLEELGLRPSAVDLLANGVDSAPLLRLQSHPRFYRLLPQRSSSLARQPCLPPLFLQLPNESAPALMKKYDNSGYWK